MNTSRFQEETLFFESFNKIFKKIQCCVQIDNVFNPLKIQVLLLKIRHLLCSINQLTGFYRMRTLMLTEFMPQTCHIQSV